MEYVFAIFMFGCMISVLILKGLMQARDFANTKLAEEDAERQIAEKLGQRDD